MNMGLLLLLLALQCALFNWFPLDSARKPGKQNDPLLHVRQAIPNNSEGHPMYCKEKIYAGTGEYSFEELRAAKWRKKAEMKAVETEQKEMKSMYTQICFIGFLTIVGIDVTGLIIFSFSTSLQSFQMSHP